MSRSAVVIGRTASDVIYNVISLTIMAMAGLIVGWRIHNGFAKAMLGFGLLLLFAYAISWIMAFVGLTVRSVEVVNNASFMVIFPLTFISNAFVPSDNLPGPLKVFAEWESRLGGHPRGSRILREHSRCGPRADHLGAPECSRLHADMGRIDDRRLRTAGGPAVRAGTNQELNSFTRDSSTGFSGF